MANTKETNSVIKDFETQHIITGEPIYTMARDLPKEDKNSSQYWKDIVERTSDIGELKALCNDMIGNYFKAACTVEVLQSERDIMIQKFTKFLSNKENDAMDDITLYRTERMEFERQIIEWQYPLPKNIISDKR